MTKTKETFQEGPSFETIGNCDGCKYLSISDELSNISTTKKITCDKLNKDLRQRSNNDSIIPHSDCPFQFLSSIKYHKDKEKRLTKLEFDKVKSIVSSIFKYSNSFNNDNCGLWISFHCSETITLTKIKQLEEKLPNYDIEFDSYDSDDISVTLNLKVV